jgi:hypothetical protein
VKVSQVQVISKIPSGYDVSCDNGEQDKPWLTLTIVTFVTGSVNFVFAADRTQPLKICVVGGDVVIDNTTKSAIEKNSKTAQKKRPFSWAKRRSTIMSVTAQV